jgi:Flp pilus assembly protein TadG
MNVRKMFSEQQGGVAILVGLSMLVLLLFAALVIDIGYGLVVKNELHNVADAAALAGARQLGRIYVALPSYSAQQSYVLTSADRAAIIAEVQDVANQNKAGGASISIDPTAILIGQWDLQTRTLTVTDAQPDAVEVTASRDGSANGPIITFLAQVMGITTLNVTSTSTRGGAQEAPTAALTGVGEAGPGEITIPVGISAEWFRNKAEFCDQPIQFHPTNSPSGCAGWMTYDMSPANSNTLRDILQQLPPFGSYQAPEAVAGGTSFQFIGGNVASALKDMEALFDANKKPDASSPTGYSWETFVVVYESTDCSNPSGPIMTVGFASVAIHNVLAPPAGQLIVGKVKCDVVQDARGGGAEFGTLGSIPGLVQ